jgi:hypothetical protein
MASPLIAARWWCGGAVLLAAFAASSVPQGPDPLAAGFADPPVEARLRCYWWWLNGNTTTAAITRDLEQMKAKGFGGALLVDADGSGQKNNRRVSPGPTFASPAWRALYRHALKEAARLDLEITLNIQSGWNLGGPMVTPAQGAKLLTWSRAVVEGPAEFNRQLTPPRARNGFYRDIAVLAYPLRNGQELPGEKGAASGRRRIRQLSVKTASEEAGFSVPVTTPLLEDGVSTPGEEDTGAKDVLDLTTAMSPDGQLRWNAPQGTWEILRIGYTSSGAVTSTSSGAWQGLAIDYLDRTAFEQYWREVIDPLLDDARPYLGRTLRYLATDSWELGGMNWTPKFREEFRTRRGYDLLGYLPVVAGRIVDTRETSTRFLNDFRRTVGDLIISQHYAVFAELAARHGLGIHPESGGPHGAPIDALETLGASAFPQTEFWARSANHRIRDEDRFFVKEASSAAHIYGRTIVAAEGPTSIGPQWDESIWDNLKPSFDQAVCEGLNRLIWHTFTSSPKEAGLPGQEYFAGTHLNPNVTWWNEAGALLGYINRTQFLLQQGQPVADVVYYYGDHVPNFVQLKSFDPARVLPGYDYDVTDENVLINRMKVRDGRIVLPEGVSYRLLVLPERSGISLEALRAVRRLVREGAVVLGTKPVRATGLADDREVRAIAGELWGTGALRVRGGHTARELLASLGVPPDLECPNASLDYVHRQAGGADIYFVRSTRPEQVNALVTLRVAGRTPELWRPENGEIEPAVEYDFTKDARTRMPLRLEPYGSVFVVFRRPAGRHAVEVAPASAPYRIRLAEGRLESGAAGRFTVRMSTGENLTAEVPRLPEPKVLGPEWTVEFAPGWGAPARVVFEGLRSWTENSNPGIRYFSGTAKYSTSFRLTAKDLAPGRLLELDLGEVRELARVRLNGRDLGVLWKKPFRVPASSAVRAGENHIEIDVTNFWPNRLIGDQRLPPEQRLTHTNITKFRADSPLLPSGLLGPVLLRTVYSVALR